MSRTTPPRSGVRTRSKQRQSEISEFLLSKPTDEQQSPVFHDTTKPTARSQSSSVSPRRVSFGVRRQTLSDIRKRHRLLRRSFGGDAQDAQIDHIENDSDRKKKCSPGLLALRSTPGHRIEEKKRRLIQSHEKIRRTADRLPIGGGVSIWPQMDNMRLCQRETVQLVIIALITAFVVFVLFAKLHGELLLSLTDYTYEVSLFSKVHSISLEGHEAFNHTMLDWHLSYRKLLEAIHERFEVINPPLTYKVYIMLYMLGVTVLIYFLLDNVFASSRLSPRRIKIWVLLLVVIGEWTVMLIVLLVSASKLEYAIEENIYQLSETLADIAHTDIDPSRFTAILSYWRIRCLPPTAHGTLTILGVFAVKDVSYYLQYYSLPIITVIVTPVFRLFSALYDIYSIKESGIPLKKAY